MILWLQHLLDDGFDPSYPCAQVDLAAQALAKRRQSLLHIVFLPDKPRSMAFWNQKRSGVNTPEIVRMEVTLPAKPEQ